MLHGGDIYSNKIELDFSVSINPLGPPKEVLEAYAASIRKIVNYPDPEYRSLKALIFKKYNIPISGIALGNGASELISAIVHSIKPKKVYVHRPCFFGYERAALGVGAKLTDIYEEAELIFVANPCNPTGRYEDRDTLETILEYSLENNIPIVVDECFMELSHSPGEHSLISELSRYKNLMILNAFTKTYSIPGVRLGYLLSSNADLADKIQKTLPEWNISVPACTMGEAALLQEGYIEKSRDYIAAEKNYLFGELRALGMEVFPSDCNFFTFTPKTEPHPGDLYKRLLDRGILIRDCSDFLGHKEGRYRLSPRNHRDNMRLIEILKEL